MKSVLIKAKIQTIYYESPADALGKSFATSDKRITIAEAGDILLDRGIEFKSVLKVKYENIQMEMDAATLEEFIV